MMASQQKGPKKNGKKEHLLAVRIKPQLMDKLAAYALKKSQRENRRVSYREIIEHYLLSL